MLDVERLGAWKMMSLWSRERPSQVLSLSLSGLLGMDAVDRTRLQAKLEFLLRPWRWCRRKREQLDTGVRMVEVVAPWLEAY